MSFAVVIDAAAINRTAERLPLLVDLNLGAAVNDTAQRTFDEARRQMLSRVNLSDAYVRERMDVEPANDLRNPVATVVAFRQGGRRKGMRGVNLRQYAAVVQQAVNNWSNNGVATNSGRTIFGTAQEQGHRKAGVGPSQRTKMYPNPRKPGGWLPFIARTGNPALQIPVGRKQAGVSVEVAKGARKTIQYAFMQRMPNGQILVMARNKGDHKGKGKIHALSSLSVWQLFKANMATIIPFAQAKLEDAVGAALDEQIKKVVE